MFITERFQLESSFIDSLRERKPPWGFGNFSAMVYYRTYSRTKEDGTQESWLDTVTRVTEGVMSIRKDWYLKHGLGWDESKWQRKAQRLAEFIFDMKVLIGRGLWAMGTDYIYERGSMALNNCGYVDIETNLSDAAGWAMNALMCGVGVGFSTENAHLGKMQPPNERIHTQFQIPDSREGWVESVEKLIKSYKEEGHPYLKFDYSKIRPKGLPLKGFGGLSSGPDPLIKLHERLRNYLGNYSNGHPNQTRLIVDVMNSIGACVVAGNVRRSAELAMGSVEDNTFLNLKNYETNPERAEIGWMSNNTVMLRNSDEFEMLPNISERIRDNGEPGIANLINVQKYGRVGKKKNDNAVGFNPCAEIPLESKELCNLAEFYPSRCSSKEEIWEAMEMATFYASTVSLLPTQNNETNQVISRNRRIGVSPSGIADWLDATNWSQITMILREGYEKYVEPYNAALAREAGVPPSVRLTTVKPSGTISQLAGVSPGMHWPVSRYAIRRVRISEQSPLVPLLIEANVPYEEDKYSDNTLCFGFPLESGKGKTRSVREVSLWEQASMVSMLQREWADNAVSNTLTFNKEEENQVERVLAAFAPTIKSMSMLPNQEDAENAYAQPPYEKITKSQYEDLLKDIGEINWGRLTGMDGKDEQFCDTEACEVEF